MFSCSRCLGAALAVALGLAAVFYATLTAPANNKGANNFSSMEKMVDSSKFELFATALPEKKVVHFVSEMPPTPVPAVSYGGDDTIRDIVDKRQPRVLLGSSASRWGALDWDLWGLAKKLPLLMGVAVAEDAVATVVPQYERDAGGMLTEQSAVPLSKVVENVFFVNFLLSFKNVAVRMFYYDDFRIFQRMVDALEDTDWRDYAIVEYVAANPNVLEDEAPSTHVDHPSEAGDGLNASVPNVWIMHPGTALQARYSPYHTFRVQIKGSARYVLIPPRHVNKHAYLHPHTHVAHGQSQIDFDDPDTTLMPAVSKLKIHEVASLNPGEVLYIPPYWMARTETDVGAMGLDVLSPSQEQLILLEASVQMVPLQQYSETKEERIISAQVYLVHVLSRLPDDVVLTPRDFAEELYTQRFSSIYPRNGLHMRRSVFNCVMGSPEEHAERIENLNKAGIYDAADRTAACVNDPSLDAAAKRLWAADYIETVARWAMQSPDEVVFFVTQCLNFENKIEIIEEVEGPSALFFNGGKED